MGIPLLSLKKVNYSYETGFKVLEDIDLHVHPKESIGLIGANGAGKSTLMKLIVGLCSDYDGEIEVEGVPVTKKNIAEVREKIGYVFQDSDNQLFMSTVFEDVAFGPRNYGYSKDEVNARVERALASVGISELRNKPIYKLSGGEKKLASIATILSMEPKLILMDEPSVALDPKNRRNLINILNELSQVKLIASHDLDFIWDTCERTVLINNGRIIADGNTKEILSNEALMLENSLELPMRLQK